jgi:tetratricopeptide (TPR) repeat protein
MMRNRKAALIAAFSLATLSLVVAVAIFKWCSDDGAVKKKSEPCKAVTAAAEAIEALMFPEGKKDGDCAEVVDVKKMNAAQFKEKLASFPGKRVYLWMPGEHLWLLVGRGNTNRVEMAKAMEAFSGETDRGSVVEVFASYVGTREDVMPAFETKLEGNVLPQWFVMKDLPKTAWISFAGIDDDIAKYTRTQMRSMQVIRRLILEGNMQAAASSDENTMEKAVECWTRAAKRNPNDPMLVERLERLSKNAEVFYRLGKFNQALKCYETLVVVRPNDPTSVYNFGICLQRLGREELANKVLSRAKQLSESLGR